MANKILVNKKTGKEFHSNDSKAVLERFPNTFRIKKGTALAKETQEKEAQVIDDVNVNIPKPQPKKNTQPTKSNKKDK